MIGRAALWYTAPVLLTGMAAALASELFAGRLGDVLLIAGCALLISCCAAMAVACGLDAVIEWRRERERSRT